MMPPLNVLYPFIIYLIHMCTSFSTLKYQLERLNFFVYLFSDSFLCSSHLTATDNDLASAKALYEQMQKDGTVVDELSLKRLAKLYRSAGETVPFTEPPVSVSLCLTHTIHSNVTECVIFGRR